MKISKFRSILFLFLATLLVLMFARLANYLVYFDYFKDSVMGLSIAEGSLRFDLLTAAYVMLLPILIILIPSKGRLSLLLKRLGLNFGFIMLIVLVLMLAGDAIYFGVVNRHTFNDIPMLLTELSFVIPFLMSDHLLLLISVSAALVLAIYLWTAKATSYFLVEGRERKYSHQLAIMFLALPILLLLIRGMDVKGKPLGIIDAYQGQNEQEANLILNGAYTMMSGTLKNYQRSDYRFFTKAQLAKKRHTDIDNVYHYPFSQQYTENKPNNRNVFIILVEALSYAYVDSLSGSSYGVTPFLDELTQKAEVYDNFYAAGQRSNLGVQALLFGLPPLESVGYIGGGLELSRLTKIGHIAESYGYHTQMLQSSKRDSIRLDSIAEYSGFSHYLGQSDIPIIRQDYPDPEAAQFGWDYGMLMKTLSLVEGSDKPFLSFSFTGTTHMPYVETPKSLQVYPYGQSTFTDFLNTVRYTDESLRLFFEKAKQQDWYENTTFIILADHTLFNSKEPSLQGAFHIPLWIYRPGTGTMPKRFSRLGSQLDILPTVIDLLGFNTQFSAMGSSLYREERTFSPVVKGQLMGAFTQQGSFLSSGEHLMIDSGTTEFKQHIAPKVEQQLKAEFQQSQQAVLNNTWSQ